MKMLLLGVAFSSLGLVQAASAADIPVKAPAAVAVVQTWTGYYFGGHAGYAWGRNSVSYTANDAGSGALFAAFPPLGAATLNARNRFNVDGGLIGAQFGYNWQIGPRWLVGLETDINLTSINGSEVRSGTVVGFPTSFVAEERIKSFGTLRGRLGVLATPSLLAFVTGGLAYAHVEQKTSFSNNLGAGGFFGGGGAVPGFLCLTAPCFAGSTSRWQAGWTAGGGIEHKWSQNLSLKAEYLYVRLQDNNSVTATAFVPSPVPGGGLSTYNANFGRTNLNIVRVGANVHFPAGN